MGTARRPLRHMRHISTAGAGLLAAAVAFAGCTMNKQEAPPLSGPSEFSTSVAISVSPDVLSQDGASQSVITITARDSGGQPMRNVALRAEISVNGTPQDFGSLSARSVVTGSDGRATLVYTAPPSPAAAVDAFTIVDIGVTPLGNDFLNSAMRIASLRLVPPHIVVPPDGLVPKFTFTPSGPQDHVSVLFDASTSTAPPNNPIASYNWNFGDGRTASGRTVSHQYDGPGTYIVQLTIVDGYGRSASTSQSLSVTAGVNPTASFAFSPTDPIPGSTVFFNASASRAAPGRTIVSYEWDFGDGATGSGPTASRRYPLAGSYNVTLVVTDDAGRKGVTSQAVPVKVPETLTAPAAIKGGTLPD